MEQQKSIRVSPPQLLNRSFAILASLLILAASLLFTPGAATADDNPLLVGGVVVTDANKADVTGSGISGKVSYNSETNTLTLENARITGTFVNDSGHGSYGIASTSSLDIYLIGDNSVVADNGNDARVIDIVAIVLLGGGKISGPGSLTVETVGAVPDSKGIYSEGNLDITGATVTATAGAATTYNSFGIYAAGSGGLNITNSTVTATAGKAGTDSKGINNNGSLQLTNSTVTATGGEAESTSFGIFNAGAFSMDEKSVLVASSGEAPEGSTSLGINGDSVVFPDGVSVKYRWGEEAPGVRVDRAVFLDMNAYAGKKYISINDYLRFTASPDVPASKIGAAITPVTMKAAGGAAPYKFTASGLPEGVTINENTGVISGTPTKATAAGTATITVTDKEDTTAEARINVGAVTEDAPTPSGGSSSGGCNAGFAGMLLLAAIPFAVRRKK